MLVISLTLVIGLVINVSNQNFVEAKDSSSKGPEVTDYFTVINEDGSTSIVDFDDRYRKHLINNGFKPLFSNGEMYFRSKSVYLDLDMKQSVIQNAYILDYKAMVEDANSRNSTFLKILRERFNTNHTK